MKRPIVPAFLALALAAAAAPAAAQTNAGGCREEGPLPNEIRCFLEAAEAADDASVCDGAYDFAVRFNCISKFAENSGDPGPCDRIPIRNNRLLLMRDACVSGVAAAIRLPQLCDQVQLAFMRDTCFMTQVLQYQAPPELCARIVRADVRELCLSPPAGSP